MGVEAGELLKITHVAQMSELMDKLNYLNVLTFFMMNLHASSFKVLRVRRDVSTVKGIHFVSICN